MAHHIQSQSGEYSYTSMSIHHLQRFSCSIFYEICPWILTICGITTVYCSLNTNVFTFASVYLDKMLFFCLLSLWAKQSWFIIHQADTVPNLPAAKWRCVRGRGGRHETDSHMDMTAPPIPCELMLGDNGIHFLRAAMFVCVCVWCVCGVCVCVGVCVVGVWCVCVGVVCVCVCVCVCACVCVCVCVCAVCVCERASERAVVMSSGSSLL